MNKTIRLPEADGTQSYRYFAEPVFIGASIVHLRCAEPGKEHRVRWAHRETWQKALQQA